MRAYMSNIHPVERSQYQRRTQDMDARALAEARAILAETEPEALTWDTPKSGHHVTLDRMGCSAYYALAEALAGFIEAEV